MNILLVVRAVGLLMALLSCQVAWAQSCEPSEQRLCLLENRFAVDVEWQDSDINLYSPLRVDQTGSAQSISLADGAGLFTFANTDRAELLVKVIDGRTINGNYWVFATAPSAKKFLLTVTDTLTQEVLQYLSPVGIPTAPIFDTQAFADGGGQKAAVERIAMQVQKQNTPGKLLGGCVPSEQLFCLVEGRFGVSADFTDFNGVSGNALGQVLPGDQSVALSLFNTDSPDVLVNLIDGSSINEQFWVSAAPLTDVELSIEVTDFVQGTQVTFSQPLGQASTATFDFGTLGDTLNRGHAGFWFNPSLNGQGLSLELHPTLGNFAFLAFYTFPEGQGFPARQAKIGSPDNRWFTGQGTYSENGADLTLFSTSGGQFATDDTVENVEIGAARFEVSDCENARFEYDIPEDGLSGTIPLVRLLPSSGGLGDLCSHLDLKGSLGLR